MWTPEEIEVAKGHAQNLMVTALDVKQAAAPVAEKVPEAPWIVSTLGDLSERLHFLIGAHSTAREGEQPEN